MFGVEMRRFLFLKYAVTSLLYRQSINSKSAVSQLTASHQKEAKSRQLAQIHPEKLCVAQSHQQRDGSEGKQFILSYELI